MVLPTELWFRVFHSLTQKSQAKFSCLWNLYNLSSWEIELLWYSNDLWFDCVKKGYLRLIQVLIQDGADVNVRNIYGKTALHWVSYIGNKDIVEALIRAGADVNIQDNNGWTALHWTTFYRCLDCIEILLRAGADVNIQDKNGITALHMASMINNNKEHLEALLRAGADVNIQDRSGRTALYWANYNNHKNYLEILNRYRISR